MRLRQLNTSLDQLTQVQGMLDQFETLNRSVETGGPMALPGVGMVAGAVNSQINRMNQISNALTPLMRNGLPGSVSDFEERMFRAATVSTDNPREANTQNIAMSRAWLERQQAFVEYMEAYANAHNTIRGARELWAHHVQHAPMFRANGSHVEVVPQPDWRDDPNLAASVGEGRHAAGEYHWNGHQLIETPAAGSQGGR